MKSSLLYKGLGIVAALAMAVLLFSAAVTASDAQGSDSRLLAVSSFGYNGSETAVFYPTTTVNLSELEDGQTMPSFLGIDFLRLPHVASGDYEEVEISSVSRMYHFSAILPPESETQDTEKRIVIDIDLSSHNPSVDKYSELRFGVNVGGGSAGTVIGAVIECEDGSTHTASVDMVTG